MNINKYLLVTKFPISFYYVNSSLDASLHESSVFFDKNGSLKTVASLFSLSPRLSLSQSLVGTKLKINPFV